MEMLLPLGYQWEYYIPSETISWATKTVTQPSLPVILFGKCAVMHLGLVAEAIKQLIPEDQQNKIVL